MIKLFANRPINIAELPVYEVVITIKDQEGKEIERKFFKMMKISELVPWIKKMNEDKNISVQYKDYHGFSSLIEKIVSSQEILEITNEIGIKSKQEPESQGENKLVVNVVSSKIV